MGVSTLLQPQALYWLIFDFEADCVQDRTVLYEYMLLIILNMQNKPKRIYGKNSQI